MSVNLSLPTVANSQLGKTVTINDIFAKVDAALTEVTSITVGGGPVTVTSAQVRAAAVILLTGQSATSVINLPAIKRLYAVSSAAANVGTSTLTVGSTTVSLSVGSTILIYTDGTTNGLKQVGGAAGGGGGTLATLTDVNVTEGAGIDGKYLKWDDGTAKWIAGTPAGGGGASDTPDALAASIVKPTLASFANTYKTGTSLSSVATTRGVYMNQAISANNNQIALVNNLPSTPYTVRAYGRFIGIPGNFCGWGLCHIDSSNSKNTLFMIGSSSSTANRFDLQDSSALGSYAADTSYAALASSPDPSSPIWLKVQDDGTSFIYWFSQDGEHWTKLATRGRTAYLAPTQVGVMLSVAQPNIAGIEVGAHIFSFDVSAGLN